MTSKLVVNTIEADTGISSVSFASSISLSSNSVFHLGNAGLNIGADTNINRPSAGVIGFNINGSEAARINANGFSGDGSQLTGLPAGLGTALSTVQTSPLNKLYYTDRILSIGSTVTVDHPASATGAYTQYADILVEDNADLIVADGDDLIPDILGLGGNGTTGAGGAGRLLVDNIVNRSGTGAPTLPNGAVVTGVVTATSFVGSGANLTGLTTPLSFRNLIINGAMMVAQRGTSSTTSDYATVDRFGWDAFAMGAAATQSQSDVASGTTPYSLGFRKAFKLTLGNNGSPAASTRVGFFYKIEAQDIANSGWNYTSSSSYITFSYWVKSSVSQNFYNTFKNDDGSSQRYVTETGTLTQDTWTKITKTIPGNSNLTFNNDNGEGLEITWELFRGTDQTGTRPLNAWAASDNNTRTPDQTSTWYSTNGATFEITGVQLEVASTSTAFEHRGFSDELRRCQRYCFRFGGGDTETYTTLCMGVQSHSTLCKLYIQFPVTMRSKDITYTFSDLTVDDDIASYSGGRIQSVNSDNSGKNSATLIFNTASMNNVNATRVLTDDVGGYIQGECEL